MFSIYAVTDQGQRTRSQLMTVLSQQDGLTRNEIVQASSGTLTYEQVRRQTENLIFERQVYSQRDDSGQRRYFIKTRQALGTLCLVPLGLWSVPVVNLTSSDADDDPIHETTEIHPCPAMADHQAI